MKRQSSVSSDEYLSYTAGTALSATLSACYLGMNEACRREMRQNDGERKSRAGWEGM